MKVNNVGWAGHVVGRGKDDITKVIVKQKIRNKKNERPERG